MKQPPDSYLIEPSGSYRP